MRRSLELKISAATRLSSTLSRSALSSLPKGARRSQAAENAPAFPVQYTMNPA